MAGSQLKRLKSTLKDQGIIGPQKSKKQKRQHAEDEKAKGDRRLQKTAALGQIREQFNPFDLKHNPRGPKFDVTTNRPPTGAAAKGISGRPGMAKSIGEQRRRETLLIEMQKRNKVGGILDRRFGENDPSLAEEEKMIERFAREKQRTHKKTSLFDLEEAEPLGELTHMGQSLNFDDSALADDFDEDDLNNGFESDDSDMLQKRLKRIRSAEMGEDGEAGEDQPERKKTKKEVMEEVIAKSKAHKYERQVAKDEDEELRLQLDKELPNLHALLSGRGKAEKANANEPSKLIAGVDRETFNKDFDLRLKKLVQDRRAAPTERTKTDEEIAEQESKRLKELEEKRLKRMRGESVSDSGEEEEEDDEDEEMEDRPDFEFIPEEEDEDFGLGKGLKARPTATELGFDDEDDFIIDDDLVASGSDLELVSEEEEDSDEEAEGEGEDDDEDDEFTKGLLNEEEVKSSVFAKGATGELEGADGDLPFTFPCPQSYEELHALAQKYPSDKLPTIVQRIRALYHPKLDSRHKEKLANFAKALVDLVGHGPRTETSPSFQSLESVIRHIHSLAKMFPIEIAVQYRSHLEEISKERPLALHVGDLTLLAAIASTFPTSDHFHQVTTPAMLTIGRYLGGKIPQTLKDYAVGIFLSTLAVQYQQFSKRYVPEVMSYCLNTLSALSPSAMAFVPGNFPLHEPAEGIRITNARKAELRQLSPADCSADVSGKEAEATKAALLGTTIQLISAAADTWTGKPAFFETFQPAHDIVAHLHSKSCRSKLPEALADQLEKSKAKLERMLKIAQLSRRPLELHHHRPLAIKTYIPKFEDSFDPNKHYDPDRERAEMAKLKAEHKKERKGAMRELRRDAQFMARENLRMKKAKDEAYEKKYKRLVAEIQNEEGKESNAYEREKAGRKKARLR
ncbi:putative nucleolar complex protein 14 [Colletotrichum sidae]|uniref:Putative nucleolar complex protein 14 n=1 Tax=Colletotrichum sidae TaxID=1347389 RepID=A0A4R8TU49_9PEZI|nr:putative nucleolar complex protein 14 [Colletotrichum sidae]